MELTFLAWLAPGLFVLFIALCVSSSRRSSRVNVPAETSRTNLVPGSQHTLDTIAVNDEPHHPPQQSFSTEGLPDMVTSLVTQPPPLYDPETTITLEERDAGVLGHTYGTTSATPVAPAEATVHREPQHVAESALGNLDQFLSDLTQGLPQEFDFFTRIATAPKTAPPALLENPALDLLLGLQVDDQYVESLGFEPGSPKLVEESSYYSKVLYAQPADALKPGAASATVVSDEYEYARDGKQKPAVQGADVYEDLSNDPITRASARASLSFASRADHKAHQTAAAAANAPADNVYGSSTPIASARPSIPEGGENFYVNSPAAKPATAAPASPARPGPPVAPKPKAGAGEDLYVNNSGAVAAAAAAFQAKSQAPTENLYMNQTAPRSPPSHPPPTDPPRSPPSHPPPTEPPQNLYVNQSELSPRAAASIAPAAAPAADNNVYEDLSKDPVAQRAARNSMSFASKTSTLSSPLKPMATTSETYVDMSDANVPKTAAAETYMDMKPAKGPAGPPRYDDVTLTSPPASSPAKPTANSYVNLTTGASPAIPAAPAAARAGDDLYVNTASLPKGATLPPQANLYVNAGSPASSKTATLDPSQPIVVAKGGDAHYDTTDDDDTWRIAPLDVARYKALNQNRCAVEQVPKCVQNKEYNRHLDVLPNPTSRVPLSPIPGDETSTYINANFVRDCQGNGKGYICTQAPMEKTLSHFWRMIWEHDIRFLIMATGLVEKGEEKCQLYWPDEMGETIYFLDIGVTLKDTRTRDGFVRNTLLVENGGQSREIVHWWFTAWPDHGVPRSNGKPDPTQCMAMLMEMRAARSRLPQSSVLMHCSAGVGRSGTLIAMDICFTLLETEGQVDPANIVFQIRKDRVALVQHPQQFELVHAACVRFCEMVKHPFEVTPDAIEKNV
uniref:Protein tyrosine phosphatase n=1 Tax=Monosiga ovata TaxID=81526 RepID=E5RKE7_9EUKA|nr:protein tyrosine phosphatase [Monosiga ovata]